MTNPITGSKKKLGVPSIQEKRAEAEAAWFYEELGGRVPEAGAAPREVVLAAIAIEASLRSTLTFHRGAMSLWFDGRRWPPCIEEQFGKGASLVIRLECALHPAVGRSNAELEQASVARLSARIAESRTKFDHGARAELLELRVRAKCHFRVALRALGDARGDGPSRVPVVTLDVEAR